MNNSQSTRKPYPYQSSLYHFSEQEPKPPCQLHTRTYAVCPHLISQELTIRNKGLKGKLSPRSKDIRHNFSEFIGSSCKVKKMCRSKTVRSNHAQKISQILEPSLYIRSKDT